MLVQYKNDYAIVDNLKFKKDKKSGYYLGYIGGKRYRLHRYIYSKYVGEIPKGYEIHHIDHNKDNNEIDNLQLLTGKEHRKIHAEELSEETKEKLRKNLNENARPKAIEWHKSEKAKKFHKEQYKISLGNRKPVKMICEFCNKEYEALNNGINRFCSNKCKSAWRRANKIDDVKRKCIKCGGEFAVNKYSKRTICQNCKSKKH